MGWQRARGDLAAAQAEVHRLEALWSRFLPGSEISGINAVAGRAVPASPETRMLARRALRAEHLTSGRFDPLMGARPMSRLIQDLIRRALADELLFGKLANGGKVTIDIDAADNVSLNFIEEKLPEPASEAPES